MEYGKKITALRKSNGMTQTELGAALNVTFQAVSKWERGESYPDFETLSKIANLFGVPISYFESGNGAEEIAPAAAVSAPPALLGVCTVCGKGIYDRNEIAETSPFVCTDCRDRKIAMDKTLKQKARADAQLKTDNDLREAKHIRNKGLIVAGIICGVLLILMIIGLCVNPVDIGETIGGYAIITLLLFPFIAQLFWQGVVVDIVLCGVKIIGTPGIIFSFDLDGFIFLIVMKILFALLKFLVLLLCMAFFSIVAIFVSLFTFIPACIKLSRGVLPD